MNNSFVQCISDICGLEISSLCADGKYSVYGNRTIVVEGHKGIASYATDKVVFAFRNFQLEVCGNNLAIKCLEKHFAVVCGSILRVEAKNV